MEPAPTTPRHEAIDHDDLLGHEWRVRQLTNCPTWAQCLELSLRHWDTGQHGVWGGLVATDRAHLRRRWPADHRGRRRTAG